jgi:hypothetical protein
LKRKQRYIQDKENQVVVVFFYTISIELRRDEKQNKKEEKSLFD